MTTAGNDTAGTREDEFLAGVYQQVTGAQAARYAAASMPARAWPGSGTGCRTTPPADPELDADQAVAQLYSLHYRPLVRLAALLVRDAATAEEVVQDAFVAVYGGWQRLGDAEKALAYLRQAVVNRSRSVLRHRTVAGDGPQQAPPDTSGAGHEAPRPAGAARRLGRAARPARPAA